MLGLTVALLIFLLNLAEHLLIISIDAKYLIFASFGSSAFLMYLMPESNSSKVSKFVKSYFAAGVIGLLCTFIVPYIGLFYSIAVVETAIAITLVGIEAKHPPAAAIGIVFLINRVGIYGIIIIIIGVATVSILTTVLKKAFYEAEKEVRRVK
ncbi:HPP family protein [Oxyplasma meridianum]|uniref:HPP family protein n=1 Tax=Oxyplasma meridianum TaxID=3073602 RepID=A0AAX4NGZ3_9ARCH